MAVTTASEKTTFDSPIVYGASTGAEEISNFVSDPHIDYASEEHIEQVAYVEVSLAQAITEYVVNKVWDSAVGGGSWVVWETEGVDASGQDYPLPGNWGISTSDYRIQSIIYRRLT